MHKLVRLAQLLDVKYGLQSRATTVPISQTRVEAEVRRDILDAYRNYFSRTARDSMFQYAADLGEASSSELVYKMDKIVKDIDKLSPDKLMHGLNEVLAIMYRMKTDPARSVRQTIHDSVPSATEAQRNTRERLLVKYERSISKAFPALQKAAIKLQVMVPTVPVHGGSISREHGELSKQQLLNFIIATPAFQQYGVTSFEVMEQVLDDPDIRQRLTTLINAVKRGLVPVDGSQVADFARQVKHRLEQAQYTNLPVLEESEIPILPEKEDE